MADDATDLTLRRPRMTYAVRLSEEGRAKLIRAATVSGRTISAELERLIHLVLPDMPSAISKLSPEAQREIGAVIAEQDEPFLRTIELGRRSKALLVEAMAPIYAKLQTTSDFAKREKLRAELDAIVSRMAQRSRRHAADVEQASEVMTNAAARKAKSSRA